MNFVGIVLTLSLVSTLATAAQPQSGYDAWAGVSGQSYPLGGTATASGGYGYELWRNASEENEPTFWQYGYVRPQLELKSALLINRVTAAIEVFPVSILGLTVGGGIDARNYNKFTDFDCSKLLCEQSLSFQFTQARLIAGFGNFVGIITGRYDWYRAETGTRPFYDEMSYLIGQAGADELKTLNVLALYRQDDIWGYGAMANYQQFIYNASNNAAMFAIGTYTEGTWRTTIGLGQFHSSHQAQGFAMVFSMTYIAQKSIGLLD